MKSLRRELLGEAHWLRPPPRPGTIVTICMSCFTTGGPGKKHGTNKPPPTGRVLESSKGDTTCPTTSQNPSLWHPSWLNNACTTRTDSESGWLVRDKMKGESHSIMSDSLWPHGLYSPWNSPGQTTGVGRHSLFQGIFPTQGSNLSLLHFRQILYQLSHQGSPRILEWVAYPFSSRSSQPRNRIGVSCISGTFFASWATRKT